MKKKSKKMKKTNNLLIAITSFLIGAIVGLTGSITYSLIEVRSDEKIKENAVGKIYDDFQVHFLELGNIYAGDSIYIKAGDNDILIDAGSRASSAKTIKSYIDEYVSDGKLEYVIATHAHQDHIAAFACTDGIFSSYQIDTLIDFNDKTKASTKVYKKYQEGRKQLIASGTKHYSAYDCYNNLNGAKQTYELATDIKMEILYNEYYEQTTNNENDYSVCLLFTCGSNKFLLTGDLETEAEKTLANKEKDKISNCDVFKAGHHGSKTANSNELLEIVKPQVSVCTCVCGSTEYTKTNENTFPTQQYIDNISKYTDKVYVTSLCNNYETGDYQSMNGNVIISSNKSNIGIACLNNTTILKDTEWFKNNRSLPESWQ